MKWNKRHQQNKQMQADLHVTHNGIMWLVSNGKEMETDLHAKRLIVIPWLSWTRPFIYMINSGTVIQALVFCFPSIPSHLAVLLRYPSFVYLCVSHPFSPTTPSVSAYHTVTLSVSNSGQMDRENHMQNLSSNWLPVALPDTSSACFLVFHSCYIVAWPVGSRKVCHICVQTVHIAAWLRKSGGVYLHCCVAAPCSLPNIHTQTHTQLQAMSHWV